MPVQPRIIDLQLPIDLQTEVRRSYGIIEYPVFGLSNIIQPVLLTNIPDYPLNVRDVAPPRPIQTFDVEEPFTLGRNWTYTDSSTLVAGGSETRSVGLIVRLLKGQTYRCRFGFYGQGSAGLVGFPLTIKLTGSRANMNVPETFDLIYCLVNSVGTGTNGRFVFQNNARHVDFQLPDGMDSFETTQIGFQIVNPTRSAQTLDTYGFFGSLAALTYNPP